MNNKQSSQILQATHTGVLSIGDISIKCAVLEDDTAVLSQRRVANVFGIKGGGTYWKKKKSVIEGDLPPEYISANYLQEFITDELREKFSNSITYISKSGSIARGIRATILPDICDVWINADRKGALTPKQKIIAQNAYILLRGFANVGIVALVYEATGYQEYLSRKRLHEILEKFISKELNKWAKTFPDDFYKEMFRLRNWGYVPLNVKRPKVVGHLTNDLVYARLAPAVLNELKRVTPKDSKGRRKHRYFQRLTEEVGNPRLREHLTAVIALMKASPNWRSFYRLIQRGLPKYGTTGELLLDYEEESEC